MNDLRQEVSRLSDRERSTEAIKERLDKGLDVRFNRTGNKERTARVPRLSSQWITNVVVKEDKEQQETCKHRQLTMYGVQYLFK